MHKCLAEFIWSRNDKITIYKYAARYLWRCLAFSVSCFYVCILQGSPPAPSVINEVIVGQVGQMVTMRFVYLGSLNGSQISPRGSNVGMPLYVHNTCRSFALKIKKTSSGPLRSCGERSSSTFPHQYHLPSPNILFLKLALNVLEVKHCKKTSVLTSSARIRQRYLFDWQMFFPSWKISCWRQCIWC